jgi:CheY-specific phosphatase CheX
LKDAKAALLLEPNNTAAKKTVIRLQKMEEERMEKLKEETMGKLKDLGNSILGNFGLSLDNFNAVQDPKTGGYSISFNQGK